MGNNLQKLATQDKVYRPLHLCTRSNQLDFSMVIHFPPVKLFPCPCSWVHGRQQKAVAALAVSGPCLQLHYQYLKGNSTNLTHQCVFTGPGESYYIM